MPKENKIRILYVQPGKYPEERIIDNTLKAYHSLVYGDIESVAPWRTNVRVVCNQEGKLNGMPPNRLLGDYDILMGSFFICGLRNGNFISLTDEQFKRYEKLYHDPIIFTDTPLGIYPMKATPEQYTRVMNDMQARKQVRHNRDNHNER